MFFGKFTLVLAIATFLKCLMGEGGIKVSEGYLGDKTFAFVHGDTKSKMNFTDAEEYCSSLGTKKNNSQSNLASIHDMKEVKVLQNWILRLERSSFWIGGSITCSLSALSKKMHLLHWINNDKVSFTNFKIPNLNVRKMKPDDKLCVSVDHVDGRWGVHQCSEKKYFLCLLKPKLIVKKLIVVTTEASNQLKVMSGNGKETSTKPARTTQTSILNTTKKSP